MLTRSNYSAPGGSMSACMDSNPQECYVNLLEKYLGIEAKLFGGTLTVKNNAVPASGSSYFSSCLATTTADLVLLEFGVNDDRSGKVRLLETTPSVSRGLEADISLLRVPRKTKISTLCYARFLRRRAPPRFSSSVRRLKFLFALGGGRTNQDFLPQICFPRFSLGRMEHQQLIPSLSSTIYPSSRKWTSKVLQICDEAKSPPSFALFSHRNVVFHQRHLKEEPADIAKWFSLGESKTVPGKFTWKGGHHPNKMHFLFFYFLLDFHLFQ